MKSDRSNRKASKGMPEPEKNEETTGPEPEGVRAIRHLVRLMKKYDLTAIDFKEGPTQIRLRRRGPEAPVSYQPAPASYLPPPQQAQTPAATATAPAAPAAPKGVVIESPMVGTFYSSSSPESPPYVNVGSTVRPDSTVCIIEAMKVFTDIPAGVAGTIAEILVKSGQTVEFGQPLFRLAP
jgi:acetyl-CoA carboxylase biotin carboxyl carrier protein